MPSTHTKGNAFTKLGLTLTAIIGVAAMGSAAHAISSGSDQVSVKIDVRDLETDRGIAKVYASLSKRAEAACAIPGPKPATLRRIVENCETGLMKDFIEDVNHSGLTAYHKAHLASEA